MKKFAIFALGFIFGAIFYMQVAQGAEYGTPYELHLEQPLCVDNKVGDDMMVRGGFRQLFGNWQRGVFLYHHKETDSLALWVTNPYLRKVCWIGMGNPALMEEEKPKRSM